MSNISMETKPLISPGITRERISYETQEKLVEEQPFADSNTPTFDQLLGQVNDFGKYQIWTVLLLCLPAAFVNSWQYYNLVFLLYNPEKECQQWNVPLRAIWKSYGNLSDQCKYEGRKIKYMYEYSLWKDENEYYGPWKDEIHCEKWTFRQQYYENTIPTQWGPCQNPVLLGNILTIFAVVNTVSDPTMGIIQDIIGRKITFFIALTISLIGSGFSLLAPSLISWVAIRAIQQTQSTLYGAVFIWALECAGPQKRTVVNFVMRLSYAFAAITLGLVAWVCQDWIQLGMITVVPFFLFYAYIFLVDESPRWLLSVGKVEEAIKIMEKIAKCNKKESQLEDVKEKMRVIAKEKVEVKEKNRVVQNMVDLFRYPNLRLELILITAILTFTNLIYQCLAFNSPNLGNIFVAYIAQAAIVLPASIFCLILPNRIGRIPPVILGLLFCGFFNFLCLPAYLYAWNQWTVIIFSAMSKFFVTISLNGMLQAAGELFPTSLRATAFGITLVVSDFGLMVMPHILATATSAKWIPMAIMGIVSILGAVCCCFLPEPMDQPMPLVAADAERYSKAGIGQMKTHWKNLIGRRDYHEVQG